MNEISPPGELLKKKGLKPRKSLGQNFLVNPGVLEKIVVAAAVIPDDVVVEIGPGTGTLTRCLVKKAGQVLAVELDRGLAEALQGEMKGCSNLHLLHGDALAQDFDFLVRQTTAQDDYKVIANLPYYITSPLLFHFLERETNWLSLTVMVQKEVADRILAAPGTKAYGALSVMINWRCEASLVTRVSPGSFFPAPAVASAVVQLKPRRELPRDIDPSLYRAVVKLAFGQRRKTLLNCLTDKAIELNREQIATALRLAGLPAGVRGEELSSQKFTELTRQIQNLKANNKA